jgi:hypothetical protein
MNFKLFLKKTSETAMIYTMGITIGITTGLSIYKFIVFPTINYKNNKYDKENI